MAAYLERLPAEVCLPVGYQVMMINDTVDLTGDGIPELALKLEKSVAMDGDTSLLQVCKKDEDGKFKLFKSLYNVYPLHFKSYGMNYVVSDSVLNEVKGRYSSHEYSEVLLQQSTLVIKFHSEATMGYNFHFFSIPKSRIGICKKLKNGQAGEEKLRR
jgi:hypothetical protein